MARNLARLRYLVLVAFGVAALSGCGMYDDQPLEGHFGPEYETRRSQLTDFCEVEVEGYGTLNVEDEYLAKVVMCEHGGAPLETLKAQAIAARGYAKYVTDVERRPLAPSVRDQHYDCGRAPTADVRQAVQATSGQVLTHNGKIIAPFYVAGSTSVDPNSCRASGGASTQQYVTYNAGRIGGQVQTSTLGWHGSPANRGCMSQNGSACLADKGWGHERILRFFYGDDIRITQLGGSCVDSSGGSSDPSNDGSPILGPPASNDPSSPGSPTNDPSSCDGAAGEPDIITRSGWGAAAPRYNRRRHTPNRFSIHHTVTSNNDSSPKRTIRSIQNYHFSRGWADIGYHYLIDQQGRIYAANPLDRMGAHVGGHNSGNVGISFLGNYQTLQPTDSQLAAAGSLIRWVSDKYGITPSSSNVKGHRDQGSTACPGNQLYPQIDRIIRYANGEADADCDDDGGGGEEAQFRYVRIKHVSADPTGDNDTIDGFEVDSVFVEEAGSGGTRMANSVSSSSGTSNASGALGQPDNDACDNRAGTVAGVGSGGELVVQFSQSFSTGDTLNVIQSNYHPGLSDCTPSGTAEIAVSADGSNWEVVQEVSGNAALGVPAASSGGGGTGPTGHNTQLAADLGEEGGTCSGVGNGGYPARCTDGRGGYSTGQCWAFVKAAMIRAGLATRADINDLASRVGMSGYSVQVSAAGFKRAADAASARDLADTVGLRKVSTPPTQAPDGAVIAWGPGCMGAHSTYGHIEISQGDGYACSDYCGRIRGDASCASVYVPTN